MTRLRLPASHQSRTRCKRFRGRRPEGWRQTISAPLGHLRLRRLRLNPKAENQLGCDFRSCALSWFPLLENLPMERLKELKRFQRIDFASIQMALPHYNSTCWML